MKASDTLATYGLDAFGVDVDKASTMLAAFAGNHPGGPQRGAAVVSWTLESLLQKSEAIDDGRSAGFRLDEDEAAILDVLISTGMYFRVKRDALTIRKA